MLLKDLQKLHTLLQLCDSNGTDAQMLELLDGDDANDSDEDIGAGDILALPRPPLMPAHAMALHVLGRGTGSMADADLSKKFRVECGGGAGDIMVTFDNFVHTSGHQRGYVSCSRGNRGQCGHQVCLIIASILCSAACCIFGSGVCEACFKYAVVHRFEDELECAAWLAAWSEAGKTNEGAFNKLDHKKFQPSLERVAFLKIQVTELE